MRDVYRRPYIQQPKKSKGKGLKVILGLLLIAGVIGAFLFFSNNGGVPLVSKEPPKPKKVRVEGRYLFNGTVVWARYMEQWSTKADGTLDYAYPFSGLAGFDRSKYDAWTADLECASSATEQVPIARAASELIFNCRPEFLAEAAKYFDFFNLANNHTHDLGETGFEETKKNLEANGITPYGNFEPGELGDICKVVPMPVRVISELDGKESAADASLPVALCAWHYFFRLPLEGEIETMKQYADVMPVFAFLQAGVEYRAKADDIQKFMAHKIVDQGPEFLVANSAHWVQDGEVYKGKPILYSTGNFIFDQQSNAEVTRSASLDASLSIPYSKDVQKWLDLGTACKTEGGDCFAKVQQKDLAKPKTSLTYELVAGDNSNKLTKRADATLQQAVETRVGWPELKAALGQ